MRTLLTFLVLVFSAITLTGQSPFPDKDEIKQFDASKTCIVLEDNPFSEYNLTIKDAVNSYWKMTPFEFINIKLSQTVRMHYYRQILKSLRNNMQHKPGNSVFK
jgi:hypothetical protein